MILILIPLISAFIGWFTNWIAIKMLFHPKNPIKFLGFTILGIFRKMHQQFDKKLGVLVATELLHFDEIAVQLKDPSKLKELNPIIEAHLDNFLKVKLQEKLPVISMFVGDNTMNKIKDGMMEEIESLLPEIITRYTDSLSARIDIEKIVTEKVSKFSSDKLEEILVSIMSKEFRFVEILGGVLGFMIGLFQVLLTYWTS